MKKLILLITMISTGMVFAQPSTPSAGEAFGKMKGGGMALTPWLGWNIPAGDAIDSAKNATSASATAASGASSASSNPGGISGGVDAYYGLNSLFSMGVSISVLQFSSVTSTTGTTTTTGGNLYVPAMLMGQLSYPIPGQEGIQAKAFAGFGYAFSVSTGSVPTGVPSTAANDPAATIGLGAAYKVLDKLWVDAGFRAGLVMSGGLKASSTINWNLTPYLGATFQL